MRKWLITRHAGALAWAKNSGIEFDQVLPHLNDASAIAAGDQVYGSLPVSLAAEICLRGGRYFHLSLQVPQELRGQELCEQQLMKLGASFREFVIQQPNTEV